MWLVGLLSVIVAIPGHTHLPFDNNKVILLTLYTALVLSVLRIVTTHIFLSGNETFSSTSLFEES